MSVTLTVTVTVTVTGVVERDKDMPGNISGSPGPSSPRYLVMYHVVSYCIMI